MKNIIKCCLIAVLSLIHIQAFAHEELLVQDPIIFTEEIEKYVNEDAATKDPVFIFDPERWGIVQGRISDEVALKNKAILNGIMAKLVDMGVFTMEIGAMDAYFKVDAPSINKIKNHNASIQIPSNFNLVMGEDTYLRVQPNSSPLYTLMSTYLADNVTISGGHLVGDRYNGHDYVPTVDADGVTRNEHGWGFLLYIIGTHNITIDGVDVSRATGDGIAIHAKSLRATDGSVGSWNRESLNVKIINSTISECRRNNISILDGTNITIDNCKILDAAKGSAVFDENGKFIYSDSGTNPRYGIDLEAIRHRNSDNELEETARIENVTISNSVFTGNYTGDIALHTPVNVKIINNQFDSRVSSYAANNIQILNNKFVARSTKMSFAISINSFKDSFTGEELNHSYRIEGNTISGSSTGGYYKNGINVAGTNQEINKNTIVDCEIGIYFKGNFSNSSFRGNRIESSLPASYGYKCFNYSQGTDNIVFSQDYVNVTNRPVSFIGFNNESTSSNIQMTFKDCTFNSINYRNFNVYLNNCKNIGFERNKGNVKLEIVDSQNILTLNNLLEFF
ncbi:right-handed parallel beta-helix repeat-containing protein [Tamlana crocina]|uniref:Right-handed parallel beta-helix repeat-containing protein n=1 Tax=Tamlana crocina TaxID=393006 RepID=A0ABX1D9W2_9FLAO|nr:right-handed parallel beta-helix repeat-containing protein [Tamlana crocina]NJX15165.1 right-handed parallel beta-helix repeat-containing protein [Tamlana crocina]